MAGLDGLRTTGFGECVRDAGARAIDAEPYRQGDAISALRGLRDGSAWFKGPVSRLCRELEADATDILIDS
jgi:hypothetical protein